MTGARDRGGWLWGAALLAGVLLAGCKGKADEEAKKEEAAIPVEIAAVTVGPIDAAYRGTATLEAEAEAMVVAKQGGVIEQVLVEEGDHVRAGQVLARLETDRLRLAQVQTRAALDKLQQDFKRIESVYQRNIVSREAYERTKYELEGARAAHDLAALALREAEIKSPIDGVVTQRQIKAGNMIQPQSPAFQVTRLDRLEAHVFVPERDIHKLAARQPATLVVDAWPEKSFKGEIERVNPVVDAKTGTVKVTVRMAPQQPDLKPGMFGRVEVLYDRREQALLVPRDAVLTEDAAQSVFVVANGHARRRAVKLGYSDPWKAEVLDGLAAGDQVVITGQNSLKDDAKVDVVNGAKTTPGAEPMQAAKDQPAG
ncbi:MAG TPA: efflux RND transporter periplasmic adaptor subunit [Nevskiaceae bacterium]|nr:efflux RND transporter periplasmic adaptor subunit [Nevskiaceae bacterium]